MDENTEIMGFVGDDGALYCSRACAARRGVLEGNDVDTDEFEGLVESGSIRAGGLCPGCGAEFAVAWPDREAN